MNEDNRKSDPLFTFVTNSKTFGVINPSFVMASSMSEWNGKGPMHIPCFQFWFDVLENDDTNEYRNIIKRANKSQRCGLLNGKFAFDMPPVVETRKQNLHTGDYERPIFIAIVNASKGCVQRMLRDGVQVVIPEKNGCNILHALVRATADFPEMERSYAKVYQMIVEKINNDEMKTLHLAEDYDHFRPIELAAKLGAWGVFRSMMESSFYEEHLGQMSVRKYYRYNVTEYESHKEQQRVLRSPLCFAAYMNEESLESFEQFKLLEMPVLRDWIFLKIKRNVVSLILWFILRIAILSLVVMIDPRAVAMNCQVTNNGNSTGGSSCGGGRGSMSSIISLIACFTATAFLILDGIELVLNRCNKDRVLAYKNMKTNYVSYTMVFRISQSILYTLCLALIICSFFGAAVAKTMIILKVCCLPFVFVSLMYILQLLPVIGHFVITLEKMLSTLLKFLVLAFLIDLMFGVHFNGTASSPSIGSSLHITFLMNTALYKFGTLPLAHVQISYAVCYCLVAIFLVSYLIAVMSRIAADTSRKMPTLHVLRRLDAAILVEERIRRFTRRICRKRRHIEIVTSKNFRSFTLDGGLHS